MKVKGDFKKYATIGGVTLLFLIIGIYAYHTTRALVNGVTINVSTIKNGATVTQPLVHITGSAVHATLLALDGRTIPVSQDGAFDESLLLAPGYNIITLDAQDRFNKKVSKSYELVYAPPATPPADAQNIIIN